MNGAKNTIPVGISNRHIHLAPNDVEILFGLGAQLTHHRTISQTGQFAAKETLDVAGPKGKISGVRVVGPNRPRTQLEIAPSDARVLGVSPPVRYSGDLDGSTGVKLVGPKGELQIREGVIVPQRHIHMNPDDAQKFGVHDRARVIVAPASRPDHNPQNESRHVVFDNVLIRVDPGFVLDFHIDVDEANAAGLKNDDHVKIIGFSDSNVPAPHSGLITENDVRKAILRKTKIRLSAQARLTPAALDLGKEFSVFEN